MSNPVEYTTQTSESGWHQGNLNKFVYVLIGGKKVGFILWNAYSKITDVATLRKADTLGVRTVIEEFDGRNAIESAAQAVANQFVAEQAALAAES